MRPLPSTPTECKTQTSRYGLSLTSLRGLQSFVMSHDGGSEGTEVMVGPVNINLGPVQIIVIQYYIDVIVVKLTFSNSSKRVRGCASGYDDIILRWDLNWLRT